MECVVLCLWRLVRWRQAPSLSALAAKSRRHCLGWRCGPARSARPARPRRCSSTASPPAGLPRRPGCSGASAGEHGRSCVTHVTQERRNDVQEMYHQPVAAGPAEPWTSCCDLNPQSVPDDTEKNVLFLYSQLQMCLTKIMLYLMAPHVGFGLDIPVSLGEKKKKTIVRLRKRWDKCVQEPSFERPSPGPCWTGRTRLLSLRGLRFSQRPIGWSWDPVKCNVNWGQDAFIHYIWFVVNCFINRPQSYVRMRTSGKENNMLTDVVAFWNIFFSSTPLLLVVLVAFLCTDCSPETSCGVFSQQTAPVDCLVSSIQTTHKHTHTCRWQSNRWKICKWFVNVCRPPFDFSLSLSTDLTVGAWFLRVESEQEFHFVDTIMQWGELFLAGDGDDQEEQDCRRHNRTLDGTCRSLKGAILAIYHCQI